jgi:hypothetical protein
LTFTVILHYLTGEIMVWRFIYRLSFRLYLPQRFTRVPLVAVENRVEMGVQLDRVISHLRVPLPTVQVPDPYPLGVLLDAPADDPILIVIVVVVRI